MEKPQSGTRMRFRHRPISNTKEETEKYRLDQLKHIRKSLGYKKKQLVEEFGKANSSASHEALDRASMIMNMVEDYLCDHAFIVLNPEAWKFAEQAHIALYNLYQCIATMDNNANPEMVDHLNENQDDK